jgi:magnesium transporter
LQDHLKLANQNLESTKEALDSLVELYISNMNIHLNEIIKRLTIISTIFIPLTFMAGIWGMNFKYMPELESPYGYPIALSVMATTGLLIYLYFKKREW